MIRTTVIALLTLTLSTVSPPPAHAQVRGSERSVISQEADGTKVTIDYGRPHVRGREPVFGGLVPWGHVWTPGANWATTLEVSNDVELNGHPVPAGRYSLWIVPDPSGFEMVLDPDDALYHTQPPEPASDQIRFTADPETTPHTEALTFDFPLVAATGMDLRFRWGTTKLDVRVDVPSSMTVTIPEDEAAPYVGTYEMTFAGPPPPQAPAGMAPPVMTVELSHESDRLVGRIVSGPEGLPAEFALVPVADQIFVPAWMMDGEIFETEVDMHFEFDVESGKASGYDVRGLEDRLMMRAERTR